MNSPSYLELSGNLITPIPFGNPLIENKLITFILVDYFVV